MPLSSGCMAGSCRERANYRPLAADGPGTARGGKSLSAHRPGTSRTGPLRFARPPTMAVELINYSGPLRAQQRNRLTDTGSQMNSNDKIVRLFSVYTVLSVGISVVAWLAVAFGLVEVSAYITSGIGLIGWLLAVTIYGLGLYAAVVLLRVGSVPIPIFITYLASQGAAVVFAYFSEGWIFFPAAGSQGTLPAVAISAAMLVYLIGLKLRRPDMA